MREKSKCNPWLGRQDRPLVPGGRYDFLLYWQRDGKTLRAAYATGELSAVVLDGADVRFLSVSDKDGV